MGAASSVFMIVTPTEMLYDIFESTEKRCLLSQPRRAGKVEYKREDLEDIYEARIQRNIGCFSLFNVGFVAVSMVCFAGGIWFAFSG